MKRKIRLITMPIILLCLSNIAFAQTGQITTQNVRADSADLKALIVTLLKWHKADKKADFEPLLKKPKDTVYTSIDWKAHKNRVAALEKTGLFTKVFLDNYQKIALQLDKALAQNKTKYFVGDLPPYGNEANEWCNCQDYPANFEKHLTIAALKINNNLATFKWSWGNKSFYAVKASKENNSWKIAALERFDVKYFSW